MSLNGRRRSVRSARFYRSDKEVSSWTKLSHSSHVDMAISLEVGRVVSRHLANDTRDSMGQVSDKNKNSNNAVCNDNGSDSSEDTEEAINNGASSKNEQVADLSTACVTSGENGSDCIGSSRPCSLEDNEPTDACRDEDYVFGKPIEENTNTVKVASLNEVKEEAGSCRNVVFGDINVNNDDERQDRQVNSLARGRGISRRGMVQRPAVLDYGLPDDNVGIMDEAFEFIITLDPNTIAGPPANNALPPTAVATQPAGASTQGQTSLNTTDVEQHESAAIAGSTQDHRRDPGESIQSPPRNYNNPLRVAPLSSTGQDSSNEFMLESAISDLDNATNPEAYPEKSSPFVQNDVVYSEYACTVESNMHDVGSSNDDDTTAESLKTASSSIRREIKISLPVNNVDLSPASIINKGIDEISPNLIADGSSQKETSYQSPTSHPNSSASNEDVAQDEEELASAENDFRSLDFALIKESMVINKERTEQDADALLDQVIGGFRDKGMGPNTVESLNGMNVSKASQKGRHSSANDPEDRCSRDNEFHNEESSVEKTGDDVSSESLASRSSPEVDNENSFECDTQSNAKVFAMDNYLDNTVTLPPKEASLHDDVGEPFVANKSCIDNEYADLCAMLPSGSLKEDSGSSKEDSGSSKEDSGSSKEDSDNLEVQSNLSKNSQQSALDCGNFCGVPFEVCDTDMINTRLHLTSESDEPKSENYVVHETNDQINTLTEEGNKEYQPFEVAQAIEDIVTVAVASSCNLRVDLHVNDTLIVDESTNTRLQNTIITDNIPQLHANGREESFNQESNQAETDTALSPWGTDNGDKVIMVTSCETNDTLEKLRSLDDHLENDIDHQHQLNSERVDTNKKLKSEDELSPVNVLNETNSANSQTSFHQEEVAEGNEFNTSSLVGLQKYDVPIQIIDNLHESQLSLTNRDDILKEKSSNQREADCDGGCFEEQKERNSLAVRHDAVAGDSNEVCWDDQIELSEEMHGCEAESRQVYTMEEHQSQTIRISVSPTLRKLSDENIIHKVPYDKTKGGNSDFADDENKESSNLCGRDVEHVKGQDCEHDETCTEQSYIIVQNDEIIDKQVTSMNCENIRNLIPFSASKSTLIIKTSRNENVENMLVREMNDNTCTKSQKVPLMETQSEYSNSAEDFARHEIIESVFDSMHKVADKEEIISKSEQFRMETLNNVSLSEYIPIAAEETVSCSIDATSAINRFTQNVVVDETRDVNQLEDKRDKEDNRSKLVYHETKDIHHPPDLVSDEHLSPYGLGQDQSQPLEDLASATNCDEMQITPNEIAKTAREDVEVNVISELTSVFTDRVETFLSQETHFYQPEGEGDKTYQPVEELKACSKPDLDYAQGDHGSNRVQTNEQTVCAVNELGEMCPNVFMFEPNKVDQTLLSTLEGRNNEREFDLGSVDVKCEGQVDVTTEITKDEDLGSLSQSRINLDICIKSDKDVCNIHDNEESAQFRYYSESVETHKDNNSETEETNKDSTHRRIGESEVAQQDFLTFDRYLKSETGEAKACSGCVIQTYTGILNETMDVSEINGLMFQTTQQPSTECIIDSEIFDGVRPGACSPGYDEQNGQSDSDFCTAVPRSGPTFEPEELISKLLVLDSKSKEVDLRDFESSSTLCSHDQSYVNDNVFALNVEERLESWKGECLTNEVHDTCDFNKEENSERDGDIDTIQETEPTALCDEPVKSSINSRELIECNKGCLIQRSSSNVICGENEGETTSNEIFINVNDNLVNVKSVNDKSVNDKSVNDKSVDDKSVDDKSVDDKSVDDKSVNDKSVNDKSVNDKSVNDKSVNDKSVDDKSVDDKSVDDKSVNDKSVNDKSVDDKSVDDKSVDDKSVNDMSEGLTSDVKSLTKHCLDDDDSSCLNEVVNQDEKVSSDNEEVKRRVTKLETTSQYLEDAAQCQVTADNTDFKDPIATGIALSEMDDKVFRANNEGRATWEGQSGKDLDRDADDGRDESMPDEKFHQQIDSNISIHEKGSSKESVSSLVIDKSVKRTSRSSTSSKSKCLLEEGPSEEIQLNQNDDMIPVAKVILDATDVWLNKISDFCQSTEMYEHDHNKLQEIAHECTTQLVALTQSSEFCQEHAQNAALLSRSGTKSNSVKSKNTSRATSSCSLASMKSEPHSDSSKSCILKDIQLCPSRNSVRSNNSKHVPLQVLGANEGSLMSIKISSNGQADKFSNHSSSCSSLFSGKTSCSSSSVSSVARVDPKESLNRQRLTEMTATVKQGSTLAKDSRSLNVVKETISWNRPRSTGNNCGDHMSKPLVSRTPSLKAPTIGKHLQNEECKAYQSLTESPANDTCVSQNIDVTERSCDTLKAANLTARSTDSGQQGVLLEKRRQPYAPTANNREGKSNIFNRTIAHLDQGTKTGQCGHKLSPRVMPATKTNENSEPSSKDPVKHERLAPCLATARRCFLRNVATQRGSESDRKTPVAVRPNELSTQKPSNFTQTEKASSQRQRFLSFAFRGLKSSPRQQDESSDKPKGEVSMGTGDFSTENKEEVMLASNSAAVSPASGEVKEDHGTNKKDQELEISKMTQLSRQRISALKLRDHVSKKSKATKMMTMQEFERIQADRHLNQAFARIQSSKPCVDCHMDAKLCEAPKRENQLRLAAGFGKHQVLGDAEIQEVSLRQS
ncbi:uncharacterized protein LOC106066673 isoform X2 [Biomphalaria glabrata]|uniref:Uncharacterized protein LOC106066673 isoform X2 n=1 Tax=Biomphalaria glabrata TaxID=6526 RepID=A0A9U8EC04_BIOGL|nr:uncharacterized protein LOC106066673 isoform X2 [Biomphalaria glabrata]